MIFLDFIFVVESWIYDDFYFYMANVEISFSQCWISID